MGKGELCCCGPGVHASVGLVGFWFSISLFVGRSLGSNDNRGFSS